MLPASNLLVPFGTIFAERLFYLPSVALCAVAGMALAALAGRMPRAGLVVASFVAVVLYARAITYARVWADNVSLFGAAVEAVPNSVKAHFNYGTFLREQGRIPEAEAQWRRALEIFPDHVESLGDLGSVYFTRDEFEKARVCWERAVKVDPNSASSWYNLGMLYGKTGDRGRAREAYREFVKTGESEYPEQVRHVRRQLESGEL